MKLEFGTLIGGFLAVFYFLKRWINELSKILEPLIEEVEKMALDGVIDKSERKALVMKAISLLEAQKKIKLNFITRIIVSRLVDYIARKLPDFKISIEAKELLKNASGS